MRWPKPTCQAMGCLPFHEHPKLQLGAALRVSKKHNHRMARASIVTVRCDRMTVLLRTGCSWISWSSFLLGPTWPGQSLGFTFPKSLGLLRNTGCFRTFVEKTNIEVLEVLNRCQETCYAVGPVEPFARLCKSITREIAIDTLKSSLVNLYVLGLMGCKLLQRVNEKNECKFR